MPSSMSEARSPARTLLSPAAVRTRAHRLLDLGIRGELRHFAVELRRG